MAYDPENPPSLIAQGIGGTTGLRWFALMWTDTIATVLTPGYISNASEIGMRAGDGLIYKDTNRGEWDHYDLIVHEIAVDGSATLRFPEVPEEALPLESITEVEPNVYAVVYRGGRQVRIPIDQAASAILTGNGVAALSFTSDLGGAPTTIRSVLEREVQGLTNDGATDCSDVLDAAWTRATGTVVENPTDSLSYLDTAPFDIRLPPGRFAYDGDGFSLLTAAPIRMVGAGSGQTVIYVDIPGGYLFDLNGYVTALHIEGIHFVCAPGTLGIYRHVVPGLGVNVGGMRVWKDCIFTNYEECAVQENGSDMPHFRMENCTLGGANGFGTVGIALQGYNDISIIRGNAFLKNKHNIKLSPAVRTGTDVGPGANMLIANNDMTRFGGVSKVSDIWIVPNAESPSTGSSVMVHDQKFGNENFVSGQFKILVADEDAGVGSDNGSRNTHSTAKSNGYVGLLDIDGCNIGTAGTNYLEAALIYSYARRISGVRWGAHNTIIGTLPKHTVIEYDAIADFDYINNHALNVIYAGPYEFDQVRRGSISNHPAGIVFDPAHIFQSDLWVPAAHHAGDDPAYIDLLGAVNIHSSGGVSSASRVQDEDVFGGDNATEVTFSASSGFVYVQPFAANIVPGQIAWLEIDIKEAATRALQGVQVGLRDSGGTFYGSRAYKIPPDWQTFRIPVFPPSAALTYRFDIRPIASDWVTGVTDKVLIGRPRLYHARNPVQQGHLATRDTGKWDGGHGILGSAMSFWVDDNEHLRLKFGDAPPTSATDGGVVALSPTVGTTAQRPTVNLYVGQVHIDLTLGKPIWWNGTNWSDFAGTSGV